MGKLLSKIRTVISVRRTANEKLYGWMEEEDLYLTDPEVLFFSK